MEGYAYLDSESRVLKIWYNADAWQMLVAGGENPQSIALFIVYVSQNHRM